MPVTSRSIRVEPRLVVFAVVLGILLIHCAQYAKFVSDDALISLRYSRRLLEGHGLTWSPGDRVEGYSDLLWVLLVAIGGVLHIDLIRTAIALDHIGVVAAVFIAAVSSRTGTLSLRRVAASALLAATVPMAVWANGGLEHGFMTGVLALAFFLFERHLIAPGRREALVLGLPLAALALLRIDGSLLVALLLTGAVLAEWLTPGPPGLTWSHAVGTVGRWLRVALTPTLTVALQLAFRRTYYGTWEPNTALAKLAFNRDRLLQGMDYLARGYRAIGVLVVVAVVATALVYSGLRRPFILRWTVILGWSLYILSIGGDIFPGWRQLIFVFIPLSFFAGDLAEWAGGRIAKKPLWLPDAAVILASALLAFAHFEAQSVDSENRRAGTERWEWAGLPLGHLLKTAFGAKSPLLAVDAAGALPYWSELPSLDMLGLNDSYIATHPPRSFGHGQIGHELGDGAYVSRRAPDLIAFNGSTGSRAPLFRSGRELVAMPQFAAQYGLVEVQASVPPSGRQRGQIWIRREGGPLGTTRTADRITIPGYLFASGPDTVAELDAEGVLAATVEKNQVGSLSHIEVPAGRWQASVALAESADALVGLRCESRSMEGAEPTARVIELTETHSIDVTVAAAAGREGPITITAVQLSRYEGDALSLRCVPPGRPLATSLEALATDKAEHLGWNHPTNFVLGAEGLTARIEQRLAVHRVDVSADNDDEYAMSLYHGEKELWGGRIASVRNGGGLARRNLVIGEGVVVEPGDEVRLTPMHGDGRYSVGHLHLVP